MRAVLEFNLPDDREDFEDAQKGSTYRAALREMDDYLRGKIKYEDTGFTDIYQAIRDELTGILADRDLSI